MKNRLTLITALLFSLTTLAQQGINYKAVIKDDLGNVLSNTTSIDVQFTIYEGAALTNSVYTETHTNVTTDANGIVILNIGNGTTTDLFTDIIWGNDEHWLNVQIDIGAGLVDVSTTQFMAVPYALHAESSNFKTVNNVTSNTPGDLDTDDFVFGSSQLEHNEPDEGPSDIRMFFDVSNGSFRSGATQSNFLIDATNGTSWNENNRGAQSFATGLNSEASGTNSFAAGERTFANGIRATSFGFFTRASAADAFSIGSSTNADGSQSFSSGNNTTASGYSSLSAGSNTRAYSLAEAVFGLYNTSYTIGSSGTQVSNPLDRLFVIGNGTFGNRSDALIVLKNGTITAPSFDLAEITDEKALITKEYLDANNATSINDLSDGKTDASGTSLFLGTTAGSNNNASFNTGVGYNTLFSNTNGSDNTAIGYTALDSNVSGSDNNAFGFSALGNNISGDDNIAIGKNTLRDMTSGSDNVAVGNNSLFNLITGSNNTALGRSALSSLQEGSGNVAIGHGAGSNLQNSSNKLFIDNKLTNQPLIYGEFDNDLIRIYGSFEVNNGFPRFQILENGTITAPNLTNSLINTAGNKALTTKEYVDSKTPIAHGIVESTGNVLSGTGNFTAFLSGNVFIIDVNGTESLSYSNTTCLITPISTSPRTASTIISDGNGDSDADLNVRIFNSSGTQVNTTFQFVIYKL